MAAFAGSPTSSVEYALYAAHDQVPSRDWGAKLRAWFFHYTHSAGAGTGEVNLIRMEPGKRRILIDQSWVYATQAAANADLHLGYRGYTKYDGTEVAADDNAFLDNEDVGGGVIDKSWQLPANGYFDVDSQTDFIIYAMIDTGNLNDNCVINGYCLAMEGN